MRSCRTMATHPLRIALWMLGTGLALLALMSVTTSQWSPATADRPLLAASTAAKPSGSIQATDRGADPAPVPVPPESSLATTEAQVVAVAPGAEPRQPPTFWEAIADGPDSAIVRDVQSVSSSAPPNSVETAPLAIRRGYEELPPPPEEHPESQTLARAEEYPRCAGLPEAAHLAPLRDLVNELSLLRRDLQQMSASEGESADSSRKQELDELRAELKPLSELGRLATLQADLQRVAERQTSLEQSLAQAAALAEAKAAEPPPQPSLRQGVTLAPSPRDASLWVAQFQQAELSEVVARLGEAGGWNLAIGRGVTGVVSLNLVDVTLEETLAAVARTLHCEIVDEQGVRTLLTRQNAAERHFASERTNARIFQLNYVAAEEAAPLIRAMLTAEIGQVVAAPPETGTAPARTHRDRLLVIDYPDVILQVESLLSEVDVPPQQIVIDAVITTVHRNERTRLGVMHALADRGVCRRRAGDRRKTDGGGALATGQFCGRPEQLIHHLEQLAETHVEATPTLTVLNRQLAELEVGNLFGYRRETEFSRHMRIHEEEIDFLPGLTRLSVRPFLQDDATVRLQVHPRLTHVVYDRSRGLPRQEVAEIATDIQVPLGCTAVLGGLTRSSDSSGIERHPKWWMFSRLSRDTSAQAVESESVEVVILLTPRLADESAARASLRSPRGIPTPLVPPYSEASEDDRAEGGPAFQGMIVPAAHSSAAPPPPLPAPPGEPRPAPELNRPWLIPPSPLP